MSKKFYLKDWHGKEKEFTDEKIFVRGEDGELIQFTQGEGAVVQPLEVTESGTYTAPDGVDGYSPVTVNVQGGGGGLPAGIYWEALNLPYKPNNPSRYYQLNGVMYRFYCSSTTTTNLRYIQKWNGSSWVSVYTHADNTLKIQVPYIQFTELNGKLHLTFGGAYSNLVSHYMLDGDTFTVLTDCPCAYVHHAFFVEGGTLKYCAIDGNVYVWNETSDTWTIERTHGFTMSALGTQHNFITSGNAVYRAYDSKLYLYSAGVNSLIGTLPTSLDLGDNPIAIGDKVYWWNARSSSQPSTLYCTNLKTAETQLLGVANGNELCKYDGMVCAYLGSGRASGLAAIMHEVTE